MDESDDYSVTTDNSFPGESAIQVPRSRDRVRGRGGAPEKGRRVLNIDETPPYFDPSRPSR